MPRATAELSDWLQHDPGARNGLIIAAKKAEGSAKHYLAGIRDERVRDMVRQLTPAEVTDIAGGGTNPFMGVPQRVYISAIEADHGSLRNQNKQLAEALAARMLG